MFKIQHFRSSDKMFTNRDMTRDVAMMVEHVDNTFDGPLFRSELLRIALDEMGWKKSDTLNIICGRKLHYLGFKNGVGLDASFASYDYIIEGLTHLQIGYDKGQIDAGILLLTFKTPERKSLDEMMVQVQKDIDALSPTISLPVAICLYDFNEPEVWN